MLTHDSKPDLTLIQTLGQMLNELGYQLKLSSEIRTRLIHATRKAWKGSELSPHTQSSHHPHPHLRGGGTTR